MASLLKNLFASPINKLNLLFVRSASKLTFPQFANLPPHHPINGTGATFVTTIKRKREIIDPNLPNFQKQEPLRWTDWRMLRDVRRRYIFARYHPMKECLYCMRKSKLLPIAIRESAKEDNLRLPRDATLKSLTNRCKISSRSRGNVKRYRISRHFFRAFADYNLLSGVAKASW